MNLRFWKSEPEKRESAPYTDAITRAIVQAAAGRTVGSVAESAALEVAAGMYSRAFSLATLTPAVPCLTPEVLALIARDLIRRGENIHLIEVKRGKLCLTPVGSWDVRGREVESGWFYRVDLFGPSGNVTHFVPGRQVVHSRYSVDPARPWLGLGPMQWATATGRIHANSELVLGDELGSSRGYVMPLPQGEAGDDDDLDDSPLADLKRDLATLAGKMVIVETSAAGWGEGKDTAPLADYQQKRIGPEPPPILETIRGESYRQVLAACGVPAELAMASPGNSAQLAQRRWIVGALASMAELVCAELRWKLDMPDLAITFERLESAEIRQAKARAFASLTAGGLGIDRSLDLAGLS